MFSETVQFCAVHIGKTGDSKEFQKLSVDHDGFRLLESLPIVVLIPFFVEAHIKMTTDS
jgi:hypothetical protein